MTAASPAPTEVDQQSSPHRRALRAAAALILVVFFLTSLVGAWIGSATLLAAGACLLAQAAVHAFAAAEGRLSASEKRILQGVVGVILCALVLATVGEIIRRLFYGGAPDAGSLIWLGVIALIAHVLCASRLMRYQPGLLGLPGLWALARVGVQSDLVILAAGLLTLPIRAPWPDLAAAIFLIWLNRRALADGLAGVRRAFTGRP